MDPRGVGTVSIELNNTAAQLLASLCLELGTEDPSGVLSRALGGVFAVRWRRLRAQIARTTPLR